MFLISEAESERREFSRRERGKSEVRKETERGSGRFERKRGRRKDSRISAFAARRREDPRVLRGGGGGVQQAQEDEKIFFRGRARDRRRVREGKRNECDAALVRASRTHDPSAIAVPTRAHWDLRGSPPSPRRVRGPRRGRRRFEKAAASCLSDFFFEREKERQTPTNVPFPGLCSPRKPPPSPQGLLSLHFTAAREGRARKAQRKGLQQQKQTERGAGESVSLLPRRLALSLQLVSSPSLLQARRCKLARL